MQKVVDLFNALDSALEQLELTANMEDPTDILREIDMAEIQKLSDIDTWHSVYMTVGERNLADMMLQRLLTRRDNIDEFIGAEPNLMWLHWVNAINRLLMKTDMRFRTQKAEQLVERLSMVTHCDIHEDPLEALERISISMEQNDMESEALRRKTVSFEDFLDNLEREMGGWNDESDEMIEEEEKEQELQPSPSELSVGTEEKTESPEPGPIDDLFRSSMDVDLQRVEFQRLSKAIQKYPEIDIMFHHEENWRKTESKAAKDSASRRYGAKGLILSIVALILLAALWAPTFEIVELKKFVVPIRHRKRSAVESSDRYHEALKRATIESLDDSMRAFPYKIHQNEVRPDQVSVIEDSYAMRLAPQKLDEVLERRFILVDVPVEEVNVEFGSEYEYHEESSLGWIPIISMLTLVAPVIIREMLSVPAPQGIKQWSRCKKGRLHRYDA